jgi:hypothetical protein
MVHPLMFDEVDIWIVAVDAAAAPAKYAML